MLDSLTSPIRAVLIILYPCFPIFCVECNGIQGLVVALSSDILV